MKLIGMLDSPYVRRCAITATVMDLPIGHESISVFRQMPQFAAYNPLLKAPSFVADDGTILMDSALILLHFEDVSGKSLRPSDPAERLRDLRLSGLAINACDKAVGVEYERKRPEAQQYRPWMDRVVNQLYAALDALEQEADFGAMLTPAAITTAVAWGFTQFVIPEYVAPGRWPKIAAHAARCEALEAFRLWPIDKE